MKSASPAGFGRRLLWLLACLAAGLGAGCAGFGLTGDTAWFLAVPACIALGWLVVANPDECLSTASRREE